MKIRFLYETNSTQSDAVNQGIEHQKSLSSAAGSLGIKITNISKLGAGQNPLKCIFHVSSMEVNADCESGGQILYNWDIYDDSSPSIKLQSFPDVGSTINFMFPASGRYRVCVEAYNQKCRSEHYCQWYDIISVIATPPNAPMCCSPYSLQELSKPYTNNRRMRIRLLLMTFQPSLPYTSITAGTRAWKKGPLGLVWWPHNVAFISVKMGGTYNELHCNGPFKTMPSYTNSHTNSSSASCIHYTFVPIFVHDNTVQSYHSLKNSGNLYELDLAICKP